LWNGQTRLAFETAAENDSETTLPATVIETALPRLHRLTANALAEITPTAAASQASAPPSEKLSAATLDTAIGTLTHRCLELIAKDGLAAWSAERIVTLQSTYAHWLHSQGHSAPDADAGSARIVAALSATLNSPDGRWVLEAHPQHASELALFSDDGEARQQHIVDRCFVADGVRWIIDYKMVEGSPDAATLKAKAESYREQLERYGALFGSDGFPVRLGVFFVAQAQLITLA